MADQTNLFSGEPTSAGHETAESQDESPTGQAAVLAFLRDNEGEAVSLAQIAAAGGWKPRTVKTYITKGMFGPLLEKEGKGAYRVRGALDLTDEGFARLMSQSTKRRGFGSQFNHLPKLLLARSRTNLALAIETFNRVGLENRLDAFVLLFIAAWEQMLKAELEQASVGSIFTGKRTVLGRRETIGFRACLDRLFPHNDLVRRNLEVICSMRDEAAHLLVAEVQPIATRFFQAGIANYCERFEGITGEHAIQSLGAGLLSLALPYSRAEPAALRERYGHARADEIAGLVRQLEKEASDTADSKFAIRIDYQMVLVKKPGKTAIRLTKVIEGEDVTGLVVEKPVSATAKYPYTFDEVVIALSERSGSMWNRNDVQAVMWKLKAKSNSVYGHKHHKFDRYTYSEALLTQIIDITRRDPEYVARAKKSYNRRAK